jgi:hypothetical protein
MTERRTTRRIPQAEWLEANQRHLMRALDGVRVQLQHRPAEVPPAAEDDDGVYALDVVTAAFGLSSFERSVLLLCAGVELDSKFAELCADGPTFSMALAALPEAHWSAATPNAPLRRWHLIEVVSSGVLTRSRLRIDERVLHFLTGIDEIDERLAGIVERFDEPLELLPTHAAIVERTVASWDGRRTPLLQLCGSDDASRRTVAASIAQRLGMTLSTAAARALPTAPAEIDLLARLWEREAMLSGSILYLDCDANDDAARNFIDRCHVPLIAGTPERRTLSPKRTRTVDVPVPPTDERRQVWEAVLECGGKAAALADVFRLSPSAIRDIAEEAGNDPDALWQSCRVRTRQRIDDLARRIDSRAEWDDLVLPPLQLSILRHVANAVRYRSTVYERWGFGRREWRGLGIAALFHGASGTGKTLAAEVLANDLKLDLYSIDLSGVVSKYIGETEKNLKRIFDSAERASAILLFDEADALFGKRSEVRDSHDRYANIEVSYLLQRMEAYPGIAILTTNMRDALDNAFLRRIRYVVDFPFPGASEREQIWRRVFPPELPLEGVDVEKLARLNIAGGNIRNVALSAAFLAAHESGAVKMAHLLHAARAEYMKLDRTLTESEVSGWL